MCGTYCYQRRRGPSTLLIRITPPHAPMSLEGEPPRATAWTPVAAAYVFAHILLALRLVRIAARARDAASVATATLQLLSALALVPAAAATRCPRKLVYGAGRLRVPVLAAFVAALALLLGAVLRAGAASEAAAYGLDRRATPVVSARVAELVISVLAVGVFRRAAAVPGLVLPVAVRLVRSAASDRFAVSGPGLKSTSPASTASVASKRHTAAGARLLEDRARTPTPALYGILLHALSSVAARLVDVVVQFLQLPQRTASIADAAAAIFSASIAWPLLALMVGILMQATPLKLVNIVRSRIETIMHLEGVVACSNVHIWEETAGVYVGTMSVRIKSGTSSSFILQSAVQAFNGIVDDLTVQVETQHETHRSGTSSHKYGGMDVPLGQNTAQV